VNGPFPEVASGIGGPIEHFGGESNAKKSSKDNSDFVELSGHDDCAVEQCDCSEITLS
jgi:hypothetical protein